jgi:hypothetical protein
MCATKKQTTSSSVSSWPRALFSWLLGPGRMLFFAVVLLCIFGGGAYLAWRKMSPRILASPEFCIGPGQIAITPLPTWIHRKPGEFQAEVFRALSLEKPLSLMDDDLVDRIKTAFSRHPWIAKVNRIEKRHPAGVAVDVVYRQPVCLVEVPGGVLAVDVEGFILPSEDFTPVEPTRYPLLTGVDRSPAGSVGSRWSDAKVVGGAEIAALLGPVWEMMKLKSIAAIPADPKATVTGSDLGRRSMEPFFVLSTRSGTQILWGYAPGATSILGELSAAEKLARLQRYFADHDTLDDAHGKPQQLDVRTMGVAR